MPKQPLRGQPLPSPLDKLRQTIEQGKVGSGKPASRQEGETTTRSVPQPDTQVAGQQGERVEVQPAIRLSDQPSSNTPGIPSDLETGQQEERETGQTFKRLAVQPGSSVANQQGEREAVLPGERESGQGGEQLAIQPARRKHEPRKDKHHWEPQTIYLQPEVRRRLKVAAALSYRDMSDLVNEALLEYLPRHES